GGPRVVFPPGGGEGTGGRATSYPMVPTCARRCPGRESSRHTPCAVLPSEPERHTGCAYYYAGPGLCQTLINVGWPSSRAGYRRLEFQPRSLTTSLATPHSTTTNPARPPGLSTRSHSAAAARYSGPTSSSVESCLPNGGLHTIRSTDSDGSGSCRASH